jgi:hypothetical protein
VESVELCDVDCVSRAVTGALHLQKVRERADGRVDARCDLNRHGIAVQIVEGGSTGHPVQDVDFARAGVQLHADRTGESVAAQLVVNRMLSAEPSERIGEASHVPYLRVRNEVRVASRANDAVRADREAPTIT